MWRAFFILITPLGLAYELQVDPAVVRAVLLTLAQHAAELLAQSDAYLAAL